MSKSTNNKLPSPNVLIVMTDQQRGDLAMPEHPAYPANLRGFAEQGVRFSNCWCPSPHCCPSRASFFTGLYPSRHGIWNNVNIEQALSTSLASNVRLWSEDLKEAGYELFYTGKWHVTKMETPADRGWTELPGINALPSNNNRTEWSSYEPLSKEQPGAGRERGQILRPGWPSIQTYGTRDEKETTSDDATLEAALNCLEQRRCETQSPWCLYTGFNAPHDPYFARQKFIDLVPEDPPLPPSFHDTLDGRPGIYRRLREQVFGQLSEAEWKELIRHYWASCLQVDDAFGQILAKLDEIGQSDNTLVLFCSDHGDYLGDHGLLCKGIPCFSSAYHVPAIMRWPAGIADPGRSVDAFVNLTDIAPTLLEVAGISPTRDFSGRSLKPFLDNQPPPADWRDATHTQCNGVELYYTQRSVRTADWSYVYNGFDLDELYDLKADPHEMENLAAHPDYKHVLEEMCTRMWRFAREEEDEIINPYWTVGLAPVGPAAAFSQNGS